MAKKTDEAHHPHKPTALPRHEEPDEPSAPAAASEASDPLADFQERGAAAQKAVDVVAKPAPVPPPPSIGRIVIYTSAGEKGSVGEQHAALITGVESETVSLRVWSRTTDYVMIAVRFSDAAPGTVEAQGRWAWPPRV
jgi:hypothetical protein